MRQNIKSTKDDAHAKDILPDRSTTSKLLRQNEETFKGKIHSVNSFKNVHMRLQLRTSVDYPGLIGRLAVLTSMETPINCSRSQVYLELEW